MIPAEPILKDFGTIKQQDALLLYDKEELLRDKDGRPITRQDPEAAKLHPITGEIIPDPDAKLPVYRYVNPRQASWPEAEFIVGNPPFIGGKDIRRELGDGYAEALWKSRGNKFKSADLVMYWWNHAADLLTRKGTKLRRFGFITTNSVVQKFSRRVLEKYLHADRSVHLVFAIPDHPWVKGAKKAAVRIAMTVVEAGPPNGAGRLYDLVDEADLDTDTPKIMLNEKVGVIASDLSVGRRRNPGHATDRGRGDLLTWRPANGCGISCLAFRSRRVGPGCTARPRSANTPLSQRPRLRE